MDLQLEGKKVALERINGQMKTARLLNCSFDEIILEADNGPTSIPAETIRHLWPA